MEERDKIMSNQKFNPVSRALLGPPLGNAIIVLSFLICSCREPHKEVQNIQKFTHEINDTNIVKKAGKGWPFKDHILHVELGTGFLNDTITIYRNDSQFITKEIITTNGSMGFSDRILIPRLDTRELTIIDNKLIEKLYFSDSVPVFLFVKKEKDKLKITPTYIIPKIEYK